MVNKPLMCYCSFITWIPANINRENNGYFQYIVFYILVAFLLVWNSKSYRSDWLDFTILFVYIYAVTLYICMYAVHSISHITRRLRCRIYMRRMFYSNYSIDSPSFSLGSTIGRAFISSYIHQMGGSCASFSIVPFL